MAKMTTDGHDEPYLLLVVVTDESKASPTTSVNDPLDLKEDLHRAGRISLEVHHEWTTQRESTNK